MRWARWSSASCVPSRQEILLVDEAGDLSCSFLKVSPSHLDEVEEIAEVGAEKGASGGTGHCLSSLREASVEHVEDLGFEEGLLEIEEACRGRSPLTPQEVQGSLHALAVNLASAGAQVLCHEELPL